MYPPKHHQEYNFENIITTIKTFPLATIISVSNNKPVITHIPLLYIPNKGKYGSLIGHMDLNNPHHKLLDNAEISVLFHGPDCYISPTYYHTKQLPTWNYIKVHIEGSVHTMNDTDTLVNSMIAMNDFLETSDNPFILDEQHEKMNKFINYIVGFEIIINKWEGKFKLSQDKLKKDQIAAKDALQTFNKQVYDQYLNTIYDRHINKK